MTDKKKSISEALAEVQRKLEQQRIEEARNASKWIRKLEQQSGATPRGSIGSTSGTATGKFVEPTTVTATPKASAPAAAAPPASAAKPSTPLPSTSGSATGRLQGTPLPTGAPAPKKVSPVKIGAGIAGAAAVGGAGYMAYKGMQDSPGAAAKGEPDKVPVPPKVERPAAPKAAAPKPAAPKERFIDTAEIYRKHGVGSNDESPGAFHRAEAEIEAAKKANPTHIDPRSDVNKYAGRLTQQRADDAAAAAKAAAPKAPAAPKATATPAAAPAAAPKAEPAPKAETPAAAPKAEPKIETVPVKKAAVPANVDLSEPDLATKFDTKPGPIGLDPTKFTKPEEKESGPKKKMSESLINSFLKLQTSGGNMFAEAKKLKGNQDKLDKNQNGKLDSQDFKMLRGEKMEEGKKADKDYDGDGKVESGKDEYLGSKIAAAKKAGKMEEAASQLDPDNKAIKPSKTTDPDFAAPSANPDAPKSPIQFTPKKEEPKKTNEETLFSEKEIAYIASIMEAEPVAKTPQDYSGSKNGPSVRDLTDEAELEEAKRGRKPGVKVGAYKRRGDVGAEPEQDKGTPHILDQIRDTKEDEKGNVKLTHPASGATATVHRKVARDFYSDYHNTERPATKQQKYADFLGKHFGGDRRIAKGQSDTPSTGPAKISLGTMKDK